MLTTLLGSSPNDQCQLTAPEIAARQSLRRFPPAWIELLTPMSPTPFAEHFTNGEFLLKRPVSPIKRYGFLRRLGTVGRLSSDVSLTM